MTINVLTVASDVEKGWHIFYKHRWHLVESVDQINYGEGRSPKRASIAFTFRGDESVIVSAVDKVTALDRDGWWRNVNDEIKRLRQTAMALTRGTAAR